MTGILHFSHVRLRLECSLKLVGDIVACQHMVSLGGREVLFVHSSQHMEVLDLEQELRVRGDQAVLSDLSEGLVVLALGVLCVQLVNPWRLCVLRIADDKLRIVDVGNHVTATSEGIRASDDDRA